MVDCVEVPFEMLGWYSHLSLSSNISYNMLFSLFSLSEFMNGMTLAGYISS